jgi:acyl carrier protein
MTSIDDFMVLLRDEIGLTVTPESIGRTLDEVPGWDSVHLLQLLVVLERETGRPVSLPEMLEARSLRHIFDLTVAA